MKLYPFQHTGSDKLVACGGVGLLAMEMGTGKTRTALDILRRFRCRRVLIVAPLSAVGVWEDEIEECVPRATFVDCTHGSTEKRAQTLLDGADGALLSYAFVGYESFWRTPLAKAAEKWAPSAVIYDEAHRLKARTTRQSRYAHKLADRIPYRLGLTGTPMPNGPQDLYSVFKALNPDLFGTRWYDFQSTYLRMGGYGGYQIVAYKNLGRLRRIVSANSFRITKAKALDLPSQVDVRVAVTLSPKEQRAYQALRTHAIAEIDGWRKGKRASGIALSRVVLTNIMRLQQITSGFVKVTDSRVIDIGRSKRNILTDLLSDALPQVGHVVVFCRFIHDVEAVLKATKKLKYPAWRLDGTVSRKDRPAVLRNFREKGGVLAGQIAVSSLAIDLTCAHVAVFFSPDYSYTNFAQARDRLHRHGQKLPVTYYHLVVPESVDDRVYAALQRKKNLASRVLDKKRAKALFE